jgi:putative radical SAM enzyme (TIGR03279 family)
MVKIVSVEQKSRAARAGIKSGDNLIAVNGREIRDVLDYRFYLAEERVTLKLDRDGNQFEVVIKKRQYDDIGLDFETPLMDKKHSCENKCIFCFIDQLPRGMRKTLYFKDDDSRLSFLHGNYITMTNLHDEDIDRIIEMHISPVNVSVHTTNPELRVKMMHNKRAGEVLSYIDRLANAGIGLCGQIVLCKGINDGAELDRTLSDLSKYYPAMQSVSIVPAGLTKYREKLYPLEEFTKEEAAAVIMQVERFAQRMYEQTDIRMFYCADELYLKAELPVPPESHYDGYPQIENGVGMIRSMIEEFYGELDYIDEYTDGECVPVCLSIATGVAAFDTLSQIAHDLESRVSGLKINVYKIINNFFGESITVAGLLTGKDIAEQLGGRELGQLVLFPENALRQGGDLFLDDMSPDELSERLGVPVAPGHNDGAQLIRDILSVRDAAQKR